MNELKSSNERVLLGLRVVAESMGDRSLLVGETFRKVTDIAKDGLTEIERLRGRESAAHELLADATSTWLTDGSRHREWLAKRDAWLKGAAAAPESRDG